MSRVVIDRAVVEQALEALKNNAGEMRVEGAISILETALAQQDEPVEPVEPVAWECKAGGLKPLTQRQYDAQPLNIRRHYTRIAPPQRLPLTEEEIEHIGMTHQSLRQVVRAAEKASWEKNNG